MSKYIGVSVPRVDGVKKVTGAAKYVGDMKWPRMLYAKCVKSPYAHAKILSIDVSAAKALKGVHDVITGDYYTKRGGLYLEDKNFLAVNTVKFCGEPVVAVAAETPEIAEAACELVKVEYEPLPVINNPMEGMAKDAILIHPELHTYKVVPIFHPQAHTNISHHHIIRKGDADAAFKYAEEHPDEYYITEHEYHVPHVQHTPIENHIAVAQYEPDGKCTVWASCQSPYAVRQALSASFDIPLNKMRIISPYVGGGFGAKAGTTIEGIIIPLAMHSKGRPVMMEYTREEEFVNSYVRQGLYTKIKTAVRKSDGKFLAVQNDFYWDGGAYTEYGVNIVKASGFASTGPYEFDNVKTDAYCVYTNNPLLNRLILSFRDWGRDCICPSGQDNFCGHRFDGQFGELPKGYDHKYVYSHFGYNLKVTDMQAAIGCEQLKKFPSFIERRRHNWNRLRAALEPAADKLILPEPAANSRPSWFGFLISVKPESGLDRNAVTRYVESHNVQTRLLFSGNLIKHPCFDQIRGTDAYRVAGELTNTDFIMNNTFWVGVYPGMTDEMIDYMAKTIIEAVNQ